MTSRVTTGRVVVRGRLTVEEAVAVALAVDAAAAEDAVSSPAVPGWRRAAWLEAIGAGRVVAAPDLPFAARRL